MKKMIGKLISIKFTDRLNITYGIVIDYNDNWTLLKNNPVDYIIDGYLLFKNKNIKGFRRDIEEKFKEKIIKKKGLLSIKNDIIPIDNIANIIKFISKKYGIFQISTKSEKTVYLGRLISINEKLLIMDCLNTIGKFEGPKEFKLEEIRFVEYNTDYINSLKLLLG